MTTNETDLSRCGCRDEAMHAAALAWQNAGPMYVEPTIRDTYEPVTTRAGGGTQGGPWTSHGHAIEGVTVDGIGRPGMVAKCGGPAICATCSQEAEQIRRQVAA